MEQPTVETQELEEAKARIVELEKENFDLQVSVEEGERQFKNDQLEIKELEEKVDGLEREVSNWEDTMAGKTRFPSATMYDDMKRDYLLEIWEHYTPQEIEAALPRR